MPSIVINEMRGLNTSRARLQLAKGELSAMQNVRQRPFDNWAKRRGIETSLVQDSPVNGIFEWDMDEIVMSMYEAGGTLTFYPQLPFTSTSVGGTVTTITPTPEPDPDPLDPTGTGTAGGISFGIEQAMRALQERVVRRGGSAYTWPAGQKDADGNALATPVATQPLSNFYGSATTATEFPQNGLYRYDCYWIANYAVTLVQSVIDRLNAECTAWLSVDPEGQATLTNYTSGTFWNGVKPTATAANYKSILAEFWVYIPKLRAYSVTASEVNTEIKQGSVAGYPDCASSIVAGYAAYSAASWSAGAPIQVETWVIGNPLPSYDVSIINRVRGKLTADLSCTSGSAAVYLKADGAGSVDGLGHASDCPVVPDGKFHLWTTAPVGGVWTSAYINNSDTPPTINSCPFPGKRTGWRIPGEIVAVVPRFTY